MCDVRGVSVAARKDVNNSMWPGGGRGGSTNQRRDRCVTSSQQASKVAPLRLSAVESSRRTESERTARSASSFVY